MTVDASDVRSPAQKSHAEQAAARDMATAQALEKARLAEQARVQARDKEAENQAHAKHHRAKPAKAASKNPPKAKKGAEYFTAKSAAEKKKSTKRGEK